MNSDLAIVKTVLLQLRLPVTVLKTLPDFVRTIPKVEIARDEARDLSRHIRVLQRGLVSGQGVVPLLTEHKFQLADVYAQERANERSTTWALLTYSFSRTRKTDAKRAAVLDEIGMATLNGLLDKVYEQSAIDYIADGKGVVEAMSEGTSALSIRFHHEAGTTKELEAVQDPQAEKWGLVVKRAKRKVPA
mgnify:CR=1 FL=1